MAPVPDPRLLVTLRPADTTTRAISERLGPVPWTYAEGSDHQRWRSVEAMLVGALPRELGTFRAEETPHLAFVQRIYTGVDGFPFDWFPPSVRIAGNVGAYAPFVAEHAVALALAAARSLVLAHAQVREGRLRPAPEQRLLFRRTALILGYGAIGRAIAERLRGFGMRCIGLTRDGRPADGVDETVPAAGLREAVARADVVFDARPLTRATRGTIDAAVLNAMRPEAIFVNIGRAATVDEEALYRHLKTHPGFRAALDVWWDEDFARGTVGSRFPFAELPNFVGTPHSAGLGPDIEPYVLDRALENVSRFFRGEPPAHVVDRAEYEGDTG